MGYLKSVVLVISRNRYSRIMPCSPGTASGNASLPFLWQDNETPEYIFVFESMLEICMYVCVCTCDCVCARAHCKTLQPKKLLNNANCCFGKLNNDLKVQNIVIVLLLLFLFAGCWAMGGWFYFIAAAAAVAAPGPN